MISLPAILYTFGETSLWKYQKLANSVPPADFARTIATKLLRPRSSDSVSHILSLDWKFSFMGEMNFNWSFTLKYFLPCIPQWFSPAVELVSLPTDSAPPPKKKDAEANDFPFQFLLKMQAKVLWMPALRRRINLNFSFASPPPKKKARRLSEQKWFLVVKLLWRKDSYEEQNFIYLRL